MQLLWVRETNKVVKVIVTVVKSYFILTRIRRQKPKPIRSLALNLGNVRAPGTGKVHKAPINAAADSMKTSRGPGLYSKSDSLQHLQ